jgi:hypothetical protein
MERRRQAGVKGRSGEEKSQRQSERGGAVQQERPRASVKTAPPGARRALSSTVMPQALAAVIRSTLSPRSPAR